MWLFETIEMRLKIHHSLSQAPHTTKGYLLRNNLYKVGQRRERKNSRQRRKEEKGKAKTEERRKKTGDRPKAEAKTEEEN